MATPIGHSLFALLIVKAGVNKAILDWRWYALGAIAANAADFDFIPGIASGDINLYHQGFSHSAFIGVVFSLILCGLFRFSRQHYRLATLSCLSAYYSHLFLDMLTADKREPIGIPLFWPVSMEHARLPWEIFHGVKHGIPGDSFGDFFSQLVTWHNLESLFVESLIFLPFFVVVTILQKGFSLKRKSDSEFVNF